MATRENLPKIVVDIQDAVTQLTQEFETIHEPITDDSQALHKLCAKLEFLFTSSLKEKSILGGRRSYWHWIFSCLKNTKGLTDGLRYVQANKEVRTSKGRGRAFIRYCLVHQTLADSLQNCIMNKTVSSQHMNSNSVLTNLTYAHAFITSLYDLNSVNFDLHSKGYDLDSGWPTFASKQLTGSVDKWAVQSHVGSIGSDQTNTSVVMETPRAQGSVYSEPYVVDPRIAELSHELNNTDQIEKERQDSKENELSQVISDLQAKNYLFHDAMSNMSTDYEAREEQWREKHEVLLRELNVYKDANTTLSSKVEQLEQKKQLLEDLFSRHTPSDFATPIASMPVLTSRNTEEVDSKLEEIRASNIALKDQLAQSKELCGQLESQLSKNKLKTESISKIRVCVEEQREEITQLRKEVEEVKQHHAIFVESVRSALEIADKDDSNELHTIVASIQSLREQSSEDLRQRSETNPDDGAVARSNSLKEENEYLVYDRDAAQSEADKHKNKVKEMEALVEELKVELDLVRNETSQKICDLEEQISLYDQEKEDQSRRYQEMLVDLKVTQENLSQTEQELEASRQQFEELQQKERMLSERSKLKVSFQNFLGDTRHRTSPDGSTFSDRSLLQCFSKLLSQRFKSPIVTETYKEKIKRTLQYEGHLEEELLTSKSDYFVEVNEKKIMIEKLQGLDEANKTLELNEDTISQLRADMRCLNEKELFRERQINFLLGKIEGFIEHIRLIDQSDDVDKVELVESPGDVPDEMEVLLRWKTKQKDFFSILEMYKKNKSELTSIREDYTLLSNEMKTYKSETVEEVNRLEHNTLELQKTNDAHLITIQDLTSKHRVLQDFKQSNSAELVKLEHSERDLSLSLEASKKVADELRLRVMEESSRRLNMEETMKAYESDIESLKDKVTQLLLDKDTLWKEKEELRDRFNEHPEDPEEPDWMADEDVNNCMSCGAAFTLTLRRHHCRSCGKIFCKNCCAKWKEKNKKPIRICNNCYKEGVLNMSNVSADDSQSWGTPQATPQKPSTPSDAAASKEYEELFSEEVNELDNSTNEEENSPSVQDRNASVRDQDNITVPARREVHLPVHIEQSGVTLHWEISTDRDINFKLFYSTTENATDTQELVPVRRIDSHVKPFTGDLVARKAGFYTLVLDNTYSRFNPKHVLYTLRTIE